MPRGPRMIDIFTHPFVTCADRRRAVLRAGVPILSLILAGRL